MNNYKFSKKFNFWNSEHITNFKEIRWIYRGKDDCAFLEIGVFEARTTVYLLDEVLTGKNCCITCIDPNLQPKGRHNLSFHTSRVIMYDESSFEILTHLLCLKKSFDFIYVDGDHNASNLLQDLVLSWKLLKVGGIILIDDYEMEATDPYFYQSHKEFNVYPRLKFIHPKIAIDAFKNIYRGQYNLIIDNYQVGLKKIVDI